MWVKLLTKLVKFAIGNEKVRSYLLTWFLDFLTEQTRKSMTNVDDEIVAKIRQDLIYLGYIEKWIYLSNKLNLRIC